MTETQNGVYVETVDFDQMFREQTVGKRLLSDMDVVKVGDRKSLIKLMITNYDTTTNISSSALKKSDSIRQEFFGARYTGFEIQSVPSCDCGNPEIAGGCNVGIICPDCGGRVEYVTEREYNPSIWWTLPTPQSVFINPNAWITLSTAISGSKSWPTFDALHYMVSTATPREKAKAEATKLDQFMKRHGFQRNLTFFKKNFETIIRALHDEGRIDRDTAWFCEMTQNAGFFCKYIPITSKQAMVNEFSDGGIKTDLSMGNIIDATINMGHLYSAIKGENGEKPPTPQTINNRVAACLRSLAQYHNQIYRTEMCKKTGWWMKDIYGGRSHFSFRGVITSLQRPHEGDELELPWGMGVTLMEYHLGNRFINRGMTANEIKGFIYQTMNKYSAMVDNDFHDLIRESPVKGIPTGFNRNPAIHKGSLKVLRITGFKTDLTDHTISMPPETSNSYNADYDGDNMNGFALLDMDRYQRMVCMAPEGITVDWNHTGVLSSVLEIHREKINLMGRRVYEEDKMLEEYMKNENIEEVD